jgi:hypothetical protein
MDEAGADKPSGAAALHSADPGRGPDSGAIAGVARPVKGVEPVVEDLRERAFPLSSVGGCSASDQLSHVLRVVGADLREPGVAIPLSFDSYGADSRLVDAEQALTNSADYLRAALSLLVAVGDGVGASLVRSCDGSRQFWGLVAEVAEVGAGRWSSGHAPLAVTSQSR